VHELVRSGDSAAIAVTQIAPRGHEVNADVLARMKQGAKGTLSVGHDLHSQIGRYTDVIYTDCWPKAGAAEYVAATFLPYRIDTAVLERMNANGFFLPCPPVTRGQEVSADAMKSPLCQNYAAKDCLLHAQNAIMEFIVNQRGT
jgi:ornithine carbamoyltransferase